ncbi:hypothetical protein Dimus_021768 [Dionaea muscipula]
MGKFMSSWAFKGGPQHETNINPTGGENDPRKYASQLWRPQPQTRAAVPVAPSSTGSSYGPPPPRKKSNGDQQNVSSGKTFEPEGKRGAVAVAPPSTGSSYGGDGSYPPPPPPPPPSQQKSDHDQQNVSSGKTIKPEGKGGAMDPDLIPRPSFRPEPAPADPPAALRPPTSQPVVPSVPQLPPYNAPHVPRTKSRTDQGAAVNVYITVLPNNYPTQSRMDGAHTYGPLLVANVPLPGGYMLNYQIPQGETEEARVLHRKESKPMDQTEVRQPTPAPAPARAPMNGSATSAVPTDQRGLEAHTNQGSATAATEKGLDAHKSVPLVAVNQPLQQPGDHSTAFAGSAKSESQQSSSKCGCCVL